MFVSQSLTIHYQPHYVIQSRETTPPYTIDAPPRSDFGLPTIPPASIFASSRDSDVRALPLRLAAGRDDSSMVRRPERILLARVSVKMGRSKGRQAPTMPSDDSTMGQYTVGVRRSVSGGFSGVDG